MYSPADATGLFIRVPGRADVRSRRQYGRPSGGYAAPLRAPTLVRRALAQRPRDTDTYQTIRTR